MGGRIPNKKEMAQLKGVAAYSYYKPRGINGLLNPHYAILGALSSSLKSSSGEDGGIDNKTKTLAIIFVIVLAAFLYQYLGGGMSNSSTSIQYTVPTDDKSDQINQEIKKIQKP